MKKSLALVVAACLASSPLFAHADTPAVVIPVAPPPTAGPHVLLPQTRPYMKKLRDFMATLKEADFQSESKELTVIPFDAKVDPDDKFRTHVLAAAPFAVGLKRNFSSVVVHPSMFTLGAIERDTAIMRPSAHPEPLVDLANWNYAGNPHFNSRALRLRAFVLVAVDMMMADNLFDAPDEKNRPKQFQLMGQILRAAYVIPSLNDAIPADVRDALLAGLKPLVRRALDHGPRQRDGGPGMNASALPGLYLATELLNDPVMKKEAEAYARTLVTDPRFFSAAGYFVHGGTLDSFNGISTFFALWGANASHWPFADEAMAKIYRLRAHLTLPEPDGTLVGPSHMSSLTSVEQPWDQWNFPARVWGAALNTDEAACFTKMPTDTELNDSIRVAVEHLNYQIREVCLVGPGLEASPWKNEPAAILANYAYRYYPKGYYTRRVELEKKGELSKLPALREGTFVRTFADEFLFAKSPAHAVTIYTGPTRETGDPESGVGLGGGALSAFWTPSTGAVILGRGVGAWSKMYKTMFESWRSIPSHAVTGITKTGKVFTSAHLDKPELKIDAKEKTYSVTARGPIPATRGGETLLTGVLDYTRQFESTATGIHITTTVKSDGKDSLAELYEAIPVFAWDAGRQPKNTLTVEFLVGGKWVPATETPTADVTAVLLHRYDGAVDVVFDQPCKVKMAPEWTDAYMTRATTRNILVDLLETRKVSYRIGAVAK